MLFEFVVQADHVARAASYPRITRGARDIALGEQVGVAGPSDDFADRVSYVRLTVPCGAGSVAVSLQDKVPGEVDVM